jgi:hypothetical protein
MAWLTLLPIAVQASSLQVHTVNLTQHSVHGRVYGSSLAGFQAWQGGVFVDKAWAVLHQVEGGANDTGKDTDGCQGPNTDSGKLSALF